MDEGPHAACALHCRPQVRGQLALTLTPTLALTLARTLRYVGNNTQLWNAATTFDEGRNGISRIKCGQRPTWARALLDHDIDCCAAWRGCEWSGFHKWKDIPTSGWKGGNQKSKKRNRTYAMLK